MVLNVLDASEWREWAASMRSGFTDAFPDAPPSQTEDASYQSLRKLLLSQKWVMAYVAPRGVGLTAWDQSERKQVQHRRRFYLLGQSLDGMQVWDIRRAMQSLRSLAEFKSTPLWLQSRKEMAGNVLYASLFEPEIARLDLYELPNSHRHGPYYLNVQRFMDLPGAVAMAAERSRIRLYQADMHDWDWPIAVSQKLGWRPEQLQIRQLPPETSTTGSR
jgi:hypothetical protein